ncbi:hypothetical protein E2C01_004825 [Portunus trituberculatus]|uniref:Uncharacterized protein n=1 Tax=Portunus trituberculatus TaxID=210409 RepID=A0A5B7CQP5_PORTR|nr:hypothetical protein [Portunus trituberculatus]
MAHSSEFFRLSMKKKNTKSVGGPSSGARRKPGAQGFLVTGTAARKRAHIWLSYCCWVRVSGGGKIAGEPSCSGSPRK